MLISSVVIFIGLIVISNAISVIGHLKVYQNLVLRILGYENSNIFKLIILESFDIIHTNNNIFFSIFSCIFIFFHNKYF